MGAMVPILLGAGAVLKHFIPARKLNRWIPLINWGIATGAAVLGGADPVTAVGIGGQEAAMATGLHQGLKNYVAPGLTVRGQKI